MKIKTPPTLIAILVFIIITGFYSTYEAASDGWTEIGFPYPFYIFTGGKIDPVTIGQINLGFTLRYFLVDLIVLGVFIFVFNYLAVRFKLIKRA